MASRRERITKENPIDDFIPQSYNDNANEKLNILWRKIKWKRKLIMAHKRCDKMEKKVYRLWVSCFKILFSKRDSATIKGEISLFPRHATSPSAYPR